MRTAAKDADKKSAGKKGSGSAASFKARMKALQDTWDAARKREAFGGPSVEDGVYEAQLVSAVEAEARSGRDQVVWTFVVTEGEEKGTQIREYDGLATEDNFFFLQQKFARLEATIPEKADQLEETLATLTAAKPLVRLRMVSKTTDSGTYQHAYIDRLLEGEGGGGEADDDEGKEDEGGEGGDLVVGARVQFPSPKTGKQLLGTVKEIDEEEEQVVVTSDKGKEYTVDVSELALVEGEADDNE